MNNRFVNNSIYSQNGWGEGAGLELYKTLVTFSGNEVTDNVATGALSDGGGGIMIYLSSFRLENNIITRNSAQTLGGGVTVYGYPQQGTEQFLVNNTIFDNIAQSFGGGLGIVMEANVVALNNILWDNTANNGREVYVGGATGAIHYCDVQGGYTGLLNLDEEPKFADNAFHLSDSSLCIGAGIDSIQIGDIWYRAPSSDFFGLPRPNPVGSSPDMGACENSLANSVTIVGEMKSILLSKFDLKQNYPNPFNPSTTISYDLPLPSHVLLQVYDVQGREVVTLVNEKMNAGMHAVEWNAASLASGVYLYRLQVKNYSETKKLILLR